MLYDPEKMLKKAKKKLSELQNEENKKIIEVFVQQLFSEGISILRVIKYIYHLLVIERKMNKDLKEIDKKDIVLFLSHIEQSNYSEWTKKDYCVVLKRFLNFIGKEELARDIKTTVKKSKRRLPKTILSKDEIKRIIESADHPRDKAMLSVLYEAGLRVGELINMKLKDLSFDRYGVVIKVHGKTGERRIRIVSSTSLLTRWLDIHPTKKDPESYLWIGLPKSRNVDGLSYGAVSRIIERAIKKAGIKKNISPHTFRHSRATHLATVLTEAEMCVYFGWVQGSDMPQTYIHLSGRDIDDKILQMHGLTETKKEKTDEFTSKICPVCGYINSPTDTFCGRCGRPLDTKTAQKLDENIKYFIEVILNDPEIIKRIAELRKIEIEKKENTHQSFSLRE